MSRFLPRRPLAFSLRTLMVLVGVVCVFATWLGSEWRLVANRKAYREKLESQGVIFGTAAANQMPINRPPEVRWTRKLFGDEAIQFIQRVAAEGDTAWQAEAIKASQRPAA